jgi:ComF family protein
MIEPCLRAIERLAPRRCRLCREPSESAINLCALCRRQLLRNTGGCPRCGLPAPPGVQHATPASCPDCLAAPNPLSRTLAPFVYEEGLAYLINRWKYHGEVQLAPTLARLWLEAVPVPPAVDALLPVPLHWARFLRRGFNQSSDLALLLARETGLEVQRRYLRRVQRTAPQARASRQQRLRGLQQAFALHGPVPGLRLAIVDDVCTTGATARTIARLLRDAGAAEVQLWCLARTPAPGHGNGNSQPGAEVSPGPRGNPQTALQPRTTA